MSLALGVVYVSGGQTARGLTCGQNETPGCQLANGRKRHCFSKDAENDQVSDRMCRPACVCKDGYVRKNWLESSPCILETECNSRSGLME